MRFSAAVSPRRECYWPGLHCGSACTADLDPGSAGTAAAPCTEGPGLAGSNLAIGHVLGGQAAMRLLDHHPRLGPAALGHEGLDDAFRLAPRLGLVAAHVPSPGRGHPRMLMR